MSAPEQQMQEPHRLSFLQALWHGEVPLGQAFWWYTVVVGSLLNLVTTILFMALVSFQASAVLSVAAFVLPVPYNLFILVAVWRSADGYGGPPERALLARILTLVWAVVASVS